jgi:hypothetical protein
MEMTAPTNKSRKGSATLASMAAPASSAPEAVFSSPAAPAAVAAVAPVAPINWDAFAAPTVAVYTRNEPVTVDREASTPLFIKNAVAFAYEEHMKAGDDKPVWVTLPLDSSETVEVFIKLAKLYAKFKGYTLRGTENPKVKAQARYMVKPKELRKKVVPTADTAVVTAA